MNNTKPKTIFDEREQLKAENAQLRREYSRLSDQTREIEKALVATQRHKEELCDQLAATKGSLTRIQAASAKTRREKMTVGERSQTVIAEIGRYSESSEIRALIEKALREQIEDCARIAEEQERERWLSADEADKNGYKKAAAEYVLTATQAKEIALRIRALAESPLSPEKRAVVGAALERVGEMETAHSD